MPTLVTSGQLTITDQSDPVNAFISNAAFVIATDSNGGNGDYSGCATTMSVLLGSADVSADWTVTAAASSGVTGSLSGRTYTVAGMTVDTGYVDLTASALGFTSVTRRFSLSKSKTGAQGTQGPAVSITASRAASFTATDGALDSGQTDITYTAAVSGIASPTYVWTFSGLQTNPTASTTATQTITAAQFGTSKSATVTCTVSGSYKDTESIVRLEKSTAAAGANNTYIDANGSIQGVSGGGGTPVSNAMVKVGGTNILPGSSNGTGWTYTAYSGTEFSRTAASTVENGYILSPYFPLSGGQEITVSFETKEDAKIISRDFFILPDDYPTAGLLTASFSKSADWTPCSVTFKTPAGWGTLTAPKSVRFRMDHNGSTDGSSATIRIRNVKIEPGNKATAWSPAPADVSAGIATAATTASWSGVSGVGKPQDGATVGAPAGTYVGGNPVDVDGMKSPNYVAGSAGWKLGDDGSAEFDSASIRGKITAKQLDAGAIRGKQITGQIIADIGAMVTAVVATPLDRLTPVTVNIGNADDFASMGGIRIYSPSSPVQYAQFTEKTEKALTVVGLTASLQPGDLIIPSTPTATARCTAGVLGNFGDSDGADFPVGHTNLILYSVQNGYFSGSYDSIYAEQLTAGGHLYYSYSFNNRLVNNAIPFVEDEVVFATPNYGYPSVDLNAYGFYGSLNLSAANCPYIPNSGNAILVDLSAAPGLQSVIEVSYSSYSGSVISIVEGREIAPQFSGTYTFIPFQTSVVIGSYDPVVVNSSMFSGSSSTVLADGGIRKTGTSKSGSVVTYGNDAAAYGGSVRVSPGSAASSMENAISLEGNSRVSGILTVANNIKFPATQAASSNANTLDDYEEGTFSPTIIGTTTAGSGTYSTKVGRYTKIGNRVLYQILLAWSAHTGTGGMRISGLPFTASANGGLCPGGVVYSGLSAGAGKQVAAYPIYGGATIFITAVDSNNGTNAEIAMDTAVTYFAVSGHYEV